MSEGGDWNERGYGIGGEESGKWLGWIERILKSERQSLNVLWKGGLGWMLEGLND